MNGASIARASGPVLRGAEQTIGNAAGRQAMTGVIDSADRPIWHELFAANHPDYLASINAAAARVPVHVHGDEERMDLVRPRLADDIDVSIHGTRPIKSHAKALVTGGVVRLDTGNPTIRHDELDAVDFGATIHDPKLAKKLRAAIRAAISGQTKPIQKTAAGLVKDGVFYNDAAHAVTHLRDRTMDTINAKDAKWLLAGSKFLGDTKSLKALAKRAAHGVRVVVVASGQTTPEQVQRAADLGLFVVHLPDETAGQYLHGNVLIKNGTEAVIGTASLRSSGMGRPGTLQRREVGWATDDADYIGAIVDRFSQAAGFDLRAYFEAPRAKR